MASPQDVVIIGGGPAGLATAIAARRVGLTVLVLEAKTPPIDKACGEGLLPSGVHALAELGIITTGLGRAFQGIRYILSDRSGRTTTVEARFRSGAGLGIRRTVLHEALVQRAIEAGAEIAWRRSVTSLSDLPPARFIVGADGLHSRVRQWSGLDEPKSHRRRFGVRCHFAIPPWTDFVEVEWGDGVEAYVTPVTDTLVGVAFLTNREPLHFDALLQQFPRLAKRLGCAQCVSQARGAGPFEARARGVIAGNCVLVGDASGYIDAITGEGLGLAFRQSLALANALRTSDLQAYAKAHKKIVTWPNRVTRGVLILDRTPALRRPLMRVLAAAPGLLSTLLALSERDG